MRALLLALAACSSPSPAPTPAPAPAPSLAPAPTPAPAPAVDLAVVFDNGRYDEAIGDDASSGCLDPARLAELRRAIAAARLTTEPPVVHPREPRRRSRPVTVRGGAHLA